MVENNGLTKLSIEIMDLTTGQKVAKQHMGLGSLGAYPTGTATSPPVAMMPGHVYSIVVTPGGKTGTSAVLTEQFMA